jgi:hypothetical protein
MKVLQKNSVGVKESNHLSATFDVQDLFVRFEGW